LVRIKAPGRSDWPMAMRDWDVAYYGRIFNASCRNTGMPTIDFPDGK
jgi:hypothetical protein